MDSIKQKPWLAETLNSITHGLGAVLALAGMAVLLFFTLRHYPDPWKIISFSIYGISLIMLFTASTLYHGVREKKTKSLLQKFDHSAIYILIAGTYTPITLVAMRNNWGWPVFVLIWVMAVAGVLFQVFFYNIKYRRLSALLYVAMGCFIVFALGPLMRAVPTGGLYWLLAGGVFYIAGVLFYLKKQNPFNHVIWHLFVLGGAICHFFAIYLYILPY